MKRLVQGVSVFALVLLILATGGLAAQGKIDINSADVETLTTLKGVGEVRAHAIVKYRQMNGPFQSLDDLKHVPGIGDKIIQDNRSNLAFGKGSDSQMSGKPSRTMTGDQKADMGKTGKGMTGAAEKAMPDTKDSAKKVTSKTR
jgi:competence protein ComEA